MEGNGMEQKSLKRWISDYYKYHKIITVEKADAVFTKSCRLMQAEYEKPDYVPGKISASSFVMEGDDPVKVLTENCRDSINYVPGEKVDQGKGRFPSDQFAMGLILYELLSGSSYVKEKRLTPGYEFPRISSQCMGGSALTASDVKREYGKLAAFMEELTRIDAGKRPQNFTEIPASEYTLVYIDADTGREIHREECSLGTMKKDHGNSIVPDLRKNGIHYRTLENQVVEIEYSFLKKEYRIFCRKEPIENPEEWNDSDLGIKVRNESGSIFLPLLSNRELSQCIQVNMENNDSEAGIGTPYLSIELMQRKRGNPTAYKIWEHPELFRTKTVYQIERQIKGEKITSLELELCNDPGTKNQLMFTLKDRNGIIKCQKSCMIS